MIRSLMDTRLFTARLNVSAPRWWDKQNAGPHPDLQAWHRVVAGPESGMRCIVAFLLSFGVWDRTDALAAAKPPLKHPAKSQQTMSSISTKTTHSHTNRLAREKSPYLLQHQHNPVDWFSWGNEAFEKARRENKPIFLSIGYSTCHWCHVMERESFESEALAEVLNQHFVSIKVDREERPDVDKIYMTYVQAATGGGGWPLNVFLTPSLKPFYGGTYFAPDNRYGKPSFLQVLTEIQKSWVTRNSAILSSADGIHKSLIDVTEQEPSREAALVAAVVHSAAKRFKQEFDEVHGGFGRAPKFPRPSQPSLLLIDARRTGDLDSLKMVLHTCKSMAAGGIYDQVGGGFSRYSVDERWLVPHFEKMLYDNAQLVHLYLDVFLTSGETGMADVVRDVLTYILRDMTHRDGGFFSAEDADSEGKEGKFYCWTKGDLEKTLTGEELKFAIDYYGVTEKGNFVDHSDPEPLPDQNVLRVARESDGRSHPELLSRVRRKLFEVRSKRVRPHLDDKVLSSWNGMMLGAMARSYAVLGDPVYLRAAERNVAFIKDKLWDQSTETLYHRWRDGERDSVQLLEAYANLLAGVLELYQATLQATHLQFATDLARSMIKRFYDPKDGGFWQSDAAAKDLILRVKEDYDGAEPSGNSVAVLALLKLAAVCENREWKLVCEKTLRLFAAKMHQSPQGLPCMLAALDFSLQEPKRVVVAGDIASKEARALIRAAHTVYEPNKVIMGTSGPVDPFAATLQPNPREKAQVYLCTGNACQLPTSNPDKVKELLLKTTVNPVGKAER